MHKGELVQMRADFETRNLEVDAKLHELRQRADRSDARHAASDARHDNSEARHDDTDAWRARSEEQQVQHAPSL